MFRPLRDFWLDEDAVATAEYALLLALFVAAGLACLNDMSCKVGWNVRLASKAFDIAGKAGG